MYQLVAIGDITVDVYFQGESLTHDKGRFNLAIGGKYYSDAFHHGLGGSAANVSIHASQLGLDSAVVAKVGENAFKNMIVQNLAKKTVSTEFLYFDRNHMSLSTILLSSSGERTIIKYSDPKEHIYVNDHAIERIMRSEIVFMGNLPDVSIAERKKLMNAVNTEDNLTAINFGNKDCEQGVKKLTGLISTVDLLIVNKYEFATLIGQKPDKIDLKKNHFKAVASDITAVIVTDSANGSYAYTKDDVFYHDAGKVTKIVDSTGAGDAFTAAFLSKYSDTKDIEMSLESATEYAMKVLSKIGAN